MKWRLDHTVFDDRTGQLWHGDQPIQVPSTASEVLRVLIERRPDLVTKDDLLREVWRGTSVDEGNLSVQITKLRELLGDDSRAPRLIRTYFGKGYAFIGSAVEDTQERTTPAAGFVLE